MKINRDLIKQILTEQVEKQKILKGIGIVVNTLKQQYPFILGWELSDELETYKLTIYINLYVDYEMVKEFYGLEPRYEKIFYLNKTLVTPLSPFKGRYDNEGVDEALKMNEELREMYKYIPEDMKMIGYGGFSDDYKEPMIDNFTFVDETTN